MTTDPTWRRGWSEWVVRFALQQGTASWTYARTVRIETDRVMVECPVWVVRFGGGMVYIVQNVLRCTTTSWCLYAVKTLEEATTLATTMAYLPPMLYPAPS